MFLKTEKSIITSPFLCKIGSIDLTNDKFIKLNCFLMFSDMELFTSHYKERLGLK